MTMIEKSIGALLLALFCVPIFNWCFGTTGGSAPMVTQGTLHGTVTASPVCPVETPDDRCRPRPVANWQVQIKGPDGNSITVTTNWQGTFSIQLPPGHYLVEVPSIRYPMHPRVTLTAVSVVAGQTTKVNISLDTGIR